MTKPVLMPCISGKCGVKSHVQGSAAEKNCKKIASGRGDLSATPRISAMKKAPKLSGPKKKRIEQKDFHVPRNNKLDLSQGGVKTSTEAELHDRGDGVEYQKITGVEITEVDNRKILANMLGTKPEDVSDDLMEFADKVDLENSIEANVRGGYYEDEVDLSVKKEVFDEIIQYVDQNHRLHDRYGITKFALDNGIKDIRGKSLNALTKEYLRKNGVNTRTKDVAGSDRAWAESSVPLSKIDWEDDVHSAPGTPRNGEMIGVLVEQPNGRYRAVSMNNKVLDGSTGRKSGTFIVIGNV